MRRLFLFSFLRDHLCCSAGSTPGCKHYKQCWTQQTVSCHIGRKLSAGWENLCHWTEQISLQNVLQKLYLNKMFKMTELLIQLTIFGFWAFIFGRLPLSFIHQFLGKRWNSSPEIMNRVVTKLLYNASLASTPGLQPVMLYLTSERKDCQIKVNFPYPLDCVVARLDEA